MDVDAHSLRRNPGGYQQLSDGGVCSLKRRDASPLGITCVTVQTGGGDGHERIDMNNPGSIHQPGCN